MSDKIPVLIAAREEERSIVLTLSKLDAASVYPVVIVNESRDHTSEVVRRFGIDPIETDIPGKLNALQLGLQALGKKSLEHVLYTDADTYPLFPAHWANHMKKALPEAGVLSGMYIAPREEPLLRRVAVSTLRVINVLDKIRTGADHISGANMMTYIKNEDVLEEVLALDNYWPKDDVAISDKVAIGTDTTKQITFDPLAVVRTSSRYFPSVKTLVKRGKGGARSTIENERETRLIPGTVPYTSQSTL